MTGTSQLQGAQQEERHVIDDLLEDANMASREKVTPRKWWWGTEIERAWARLREVEEQTVHLLPDPELPACAANAARHGNSYLDANDQRLQHLQALRANRIRQRQPTNCVPRSSVSSGQHMTRRTKPTGKPVTFGTDY